MKRFKPWLIIFLVFFAGTITGVVGTHMAVRHFIMRLAKHPEVLRNRIEHDLVKRLALDPDQQAKAHETLLSAQTQIRELRGEFSPRFAAIITNAEAQISATLTPGQRERFDKYREKYQRYLWPHDQP